jgi:penicillin-binding protein 1B
MKINHITIPSVITLTIATVITFESALFTREYFAAARYLKQHDPRKSGNLTGTLVFARPKVYRRGQQLRPEELIDHLTRIGFSRSDSVEPGTFRINGGNYAGGTPALPGYAGGTPALPGHAVGTPALPAYAGGTRALASSTLHFNSRLAEFPSATLTFEGGRIVSISVDSRSVDQVDVEPETLIAFMRMVRDERAPKMNVRRVVLPASDLIPSILYDAVRASEDKRFESSSGIDEPGIARSIFNHFSSGSHSGGSGSGITQQLMKNAVLKDSDRTFDRKTRELFLSLAATRMMTKQEIFAAYANNVYLGHVENGPTLFGFEVASREFFGASARELTLSQAATLAGMLDKPETYLRAAHNNDYSLLIARRERVLSLMRKDFPERYSSEIISQALAEPLQFVFASEREAGRSLDLISKPFEIFAASELVDALGQDSETGDLHIFTTIEPELQLAAHRAISDQLTRLDPMVARVRRNLPVEQRGDEPIQAALVAMDAQTGEILAMVSGRNSEFNYATAERLPGSAIKPFVYLQAIAEGRHNGEPFTAATVIDPRNDAVDNYRPSSHLGGPATARALLAHSDNGAAVVTAHDAGLASVRDLIARLTGSRPIELTGMLAIGGAAGCEVSVLKLCEGYSVFPNDGFKIAHTPFAAVYRDGVTITVPHMAPERVTAAAPAFVVTQVMRSVLKPGGTASGALALAGLSSDSAVAGKTGTGEISDLWFVGFSRRLIVVVWVGMPNNKPRLDMSNGFTGASAAMPIWATFMRAVKTHRPDLLEGDFETPAGVRVLKIDPKRGCVTDAPGVEEFFVEGREPRRCSE